MVTLPNGTKEYRISDHLASLRVLLTQTGEYHYDYDPWGNQPAVAGIPPRRGFNARERDGESGLLKLGVREYDSEERGSFTSIDPLWEKFPHQSPYVYANNNPLSVTDPDGKQGVSIINRHMPFSADALCDAGNGVGGAGVVLLIGLIIKEVTEEKSPPAPMPAAVFQPNTQLAKDSRVVLGMNSALILQNAAGGESGSESLPDLTGKTVEEAKKALEEAGFIDKGKTEGGYQKWYHPDGSKVQIDPNGRVIRTAPREPVPGGGGRKYSPRVGPDGKVRGPNEPHITGENLQQ